MIYNFHDRLRNALNFNKFEVRDLLFIEYNCPLDLETIKIWSKFDYIIYVLSGKKTWKTTRDSWTVTAGEALYVKKGANVIQQYFVEDFCMLGFFITDDVIKNTVQSLKEKGSAPHEFTHPETIIKLNAIPNLDAFYQSMLSYFRYSHAPMSDLLELKARELLLYIISSGSFPGLTSYFHEIASNNHSVFRAIMEENYMFNLKLEAFASLCNRSLSSFKRDFKSIFGTTPGKWLLQKRLQLAAKHLTTTDNSVSMIAFDSGFEDLSHFSKAFKKQFGETPNTYRKVMN